MTKKIPYIIKEFERFAKEKEGTLDVHITSSKPVTDSTIEAVRKALGAASSADIVTNTDEALIGGLVVRQGNTILDGSLKTQIEKLRMNLN